MSRDPAGRFCWVDLAATDAAHAVDFYTGLFGWNAREHRANGGSLVRLAHEGRDVGSLYQMRDTARRTGVASHWTPYVKVEDARAACERASELGGSLVVSPFTVDGMARIALVVDPVGAAFGLWEDLRE